MLQDIRYALQRSLTNAIVWETSAKFHTNKFAHPLTVLVYITYYLSNSMKRNILFTVALGMTALLGLPSCIPNKTTQAEIKTKQEIKIAGSSSTYRVMKILADGYMSQNQNVKVTFLPKSQSGSGIAAVQEGLADIASVSRKLNPKEKYSPVIYKEIAKDGLVVATHPNVKGVNNLTTSQLKAIYSGAVINWQELGGQNAEIVLLDRPEDESAKRLLRQYYLGKELKNAPKAAIMRHEPDLINALQNTPNSIGAFSLGYSISNKLPVNHLSLNNVEATPENIKSDKYKMVREIGIVGEENPSAATQAFLDFALSEKGNQLLDNFGYAPSTQK